MDPRFTRRRTRRGAGFTLLEVMIAMTILAIGLLSLAALQMHALQGGREGRHTTQAASVARDQMEIFQRMPWLGIAPTAGWVAGPAQTTSVQAAGGPRAEETYNVAWRISDVAVGFTRAIDIRVIWNDDKSNRNKTLLLSSVRYNW